MKFVWLFLILTTDLFARDCHQQLLLSQSFTEFMENWEQDTQVVMYQFASMEDGQLARLKNCLQYQGCAQSEERLRFAAGRFSYQVAVSYKDETNRDLIEACLKDQRTFQNIDLPNNLRQSFAEIEALLVNKQPQKALDLALKVMGFKTHGYQIKISQNIEQTVAETNHDTKEVLLGELVLSSPAMLFYYLRHELEHVEQGQQGIKCYDLVGKSDFLDHRHRERSAHINDLVAVKKICGTDQACLGMLYENSLQRCLEYYR